LNDEARDIKIIVWYAGAKKMMNKDDKKDPSCLIYRVYKTGRDLITRIRRS